MQIKRKKNLITLTLNLKEIKTLLQQVERAGFDYSDCSVKAALSDDLYLTTYHQQKLDDCKDFVEKVKKVIE